MDDDFNDINGNEAYNENVLKIEKDCVLLSSGKKISCEVAVWATGAEPQKVNINSDLDLLNNEAGIILKTVKYMINIINAALILTKYLNKYLCKILLKKNPEDINKNINQIADSKKNLGLL
jgi:hypothetical protein